MSRLLAIIAFIALVVVGLDLTIDLPLPVDTVELYDMTIGL